VSLIGLKDEFDDESSTIEEDEDMNTGSSKVDLIVSDFVDGSGNPVQSKHDDEDKEDTKENEREKAKKDAG